jgi:hypothetical protein
MTKRLRAGLIGAVLVGALGLTACDPGAQAETPSPTQNAITWWFGDIGITDQATNVAQCESTLNPDAVSSGGGNWGLFQINTVHSSNFEAVTGHSWSEVLDPFLNAWYARYLYDSSGGWGPWACRWAA